VTVEDFIACFEKVSGRDLAQFMTWYNQAGTPELVCQLKHDMRTKTAELTVSQVLAPTPGQVKKKPLHIPLRLGLLGGNGQELELKLASGERVQDGMLEIRKRTETFRFRDVASRPVPSLLRGFSAPVNLTLDLTDADLQFLMAHDSDLYNRWQSAQDYATRVLVEAVKTVRGGQKPKPAREFVKALGLTLADDTLEPGYRAQFILLPSESDLARVIARDVDPLAIHKARNDLRKAIGSMLADELVEVYRKNEVKGPFSPASEPAGRRILRNTALGYLASRGRAEDVARVVRHFKEANNATDEVGALSILSQLRSPERAKALERFYERWKDDHLVVDSWFAYQAMSPLASALTSVKQLTRHPLFSIKNPNKVRALIGTFAHGNLVNFNRPDGSGYEFVADRVLELDAFNPQIAARLLSAFRSWKALEPERRKMAKKALQRVAKAKPLSHDVFEIVSKMLE
jgi:aminopeptidase N